MKKMLSYLKGNRLFAVLGPLFKLLEASLELAVPLVVARIIDVAIPNADKGYALKMCLVLVLFGFIGLVFSVTAQFFAAKASVSFCGSLRSALFKKINAFSLSQFDSLGGSTLITRLTGDMNQVQTGLNLALRLLLRSPFVVFGAAIMAFTVDAKSALIFTLVIPLLTVVVFGIMLISMPLYKKTQERVDGLLLRVRESLTGVRVIRAFCREDEETEAFSRQNDGLTQHQRRVGRISALLNPLTYVIINLAIILLIYTGALRIDAGDLTQGQLVALYNYMSQILIELIKLADLIINISKAVASGRRIFHVLDRESGDTVNVIPDCKGYTGGAAVSFENVSMKYTENAEEALKNITLRVNAGENVGIIGSTGSGKSTLVNLILRLYDATDGIVRIDGEDVKSLDRGLLRSRIGIVLQKNRLFKGSIRENLLLGNPDATDGELISAVEAAQAKDVVESKGGLDGLIEQNGRNLSGGQKQRIAIARALVKRPQILILDDSSSALDYLTDAALRKAVRELSREMTVFTVSQRTSSIEDCDRILVLEEGEAVGIGTHTELLSSCEVYREIHESQFRR